MLLTATLLLLLLAGCRPGEPERRQLEVHQISSGSAFQGRKEPLAVIAPSRRALEEALGGAVPGGLPEGRGAPGEREAVYLAVFWGRKPSGGYSVEVASARLEDGKLVVCLELRAPRPGEIVTQALTYPYAVAEITGADPAGKVVVLTDREGRRLNWPVRRA